MRGYVNYELKAAEFINSNWDICEKYCNEKMLKKEASDFLKSVAVYLGSSIHNSGRIGYLISRVFKRLLVIKNNTNTNIQKWNNTDNKPIHSYEIIFNDNVGMFKGTYYNLKSGEVWVNNRQSDTVNWDDVFEWIYYPTNN